MALVSLRRTGVAVLLLTMGCAQLRYPSHVEMVTVENAAPPPLPPSSEPPRIEPPPGSRRASATARHWRGLVIGGTILTLAGIGLLVGGAVGSDMQQRADARANAECMARQGWFCGLFDGLDQIPYHTLIGVGATSGVSGAVLLILGLNGQASERAR